MSLSDELYERDAKIAKVESEIEKIKPLENILDLEHEEIELRDDTGVYGDVYNNGNYIPSYIKVNSEATRLRGLIGRYGIPIGKDGSERFSIIPTKQGAWIGKMRDYDGWHSVSLTYCYRNKKERKKIREYLAKILGTDNIKKYVK